MMQALLLAILSARLSGSFAFVSPATGNQKIPSASATSTSDTGRYAAAAANDDESGGSSAENEAPSSPFTALPPIGASSFWDRPENEKENANNNAFANTSNEASSSDWNTFSNFPDNPSKQINIVTQHTNLVSPKFQLQYTCKVCSTRNTHSVTRMAYRKGVVIAMCKGCGSKHLIADNLGWSNYIGGFDFDNGERDIEAYMANREEENGGEDGGVEKDLVMRVTKEVFDLENVLYGGGGGGSSNGEEQVLSVKDVEDEDNNLTWS
mmetsp:Transcript_20684/g.43523  ORF Transcript_20684/g.43523 Transcript_20684/m.43523 type:complete len:266 (-) Transcript_20684:275-1072(-)